jgi:hypothetical protein
LLEFYEEMRMNPIDIGQAGAGSSQSGQRLALDNLIRRELKVGDPGDAAQIAQALLARYRDDPRARAMQQEAQGLPFLQASSAPAPSQQQNSATALDLAQAMADVEADLRELTTNNQAKDIVPELDGWAQAIRALCQQAVAAARMAMDTRNRDKAFALRRQIGDFARLARLVGVLTPPLNADYRSLAQSLDEVAAVVLVLMGETLANNGFAGGRYLLQVSFAELQARRDAVLNALRNLTGATQMAFDPNDWSRGIDAYRQLFQFLESGGLGDLRSLLEESELASSMDEMIQLTGGGAPDALRALGATAFTQLNRFTRFVQLTMNAVRPPSPPLVAFLEALQTFIDGFGSAGGVRLLRIARPAILFYGLYGTEPMTNAERRLLVLVNNRGIIAGKLDCVTRCACDDNTVRAQILLDKMLYDIDRAIDLYCIGESDLGLPEARAAAYSFTIEQTASYIGDQSTLGAKVPLVNPSNLVQDMIDTLRPTAGGLWDSDSTRDGRLHDQLPALDQELCMDALADGGLRDIVQQMTANCMPIDTVFGDLRAVLERAREQLAGAGGAVLPCRTGQIEIPDDSDTSLASIADELDLSGGQRGGREDARRVERGGAPTRTELMRHVRWLEERVESLERLRGGRLDGTPSGQDLDQSGGGGFPPQRPY